MALASRDAPEAAIAWLLSVPQSNKWPKGDGHEATRWAHLSGAIESIRRIPSWDKMFQTDGTRAKNGTAAWKLAGDAIVAANPPKEAKDALLEVALAHIQSLSGQAEREAQGETWGVGAALRLASDAGTTAGALASGVMVGIGLPDLLDAQQAPGGSAFEERERERKEREEANKHSITPLKLLLWGVPVLLLGGAVWYIWPFRAPATRARTAAARQLAPPMPTPDPRPAQAGVANMPRGLAARAYGLSFEVAPFEDTPLTPGLDFESVDMEPGRRRYLPLPPNYAEPPRDSGDDGGFDPGYDQLPSGDFRDW